MVKVATHDNPKAPVSNTLKVVLVGVVPWKVSLPEVDIPYGQSD